MWIITTRGFLSAVRNLDSNDPGDALLVRGRVREDLDNFADFVARRGDRPVVSSTPAADYGYRLTTSREALAAFLAERVDALTYPNFKSEVAKTDPTRAHVYFGVWTALLKLRGTRT